MCLRRIPLDVPEELSRLLLKQHKYGLLRHYLFVTVHAVQSFTGCFDSGRRLAHALQRVPGICSFLVVVHMSIGWKRKGVQGMKGTGKSRLFAWGRTIYTLHPNHPSSCGVRHGTPCPNGRQPQLVYLLVGAVGLLPTLEVKVPFRARLQVFHPDLCPKPQIKGRNGFGTLEVRWRHVETIRGAQRRVKALEDTEKCERAKDHTGAPRRVTACKGASRVLRVS